MLACIQDMSTILIEVRRAKPSDATAIAATHDEAWRGAYQEVIPGPELDKLINRRGPQWWDSAIRKGSRIAVLAFGDCVAGYADYGRNRARSLYYDGEIFSFICGRNFRGWASAASCLPRRGAISCKAGCKAWWCGRSRTTSPQSAYRALAGKADARSSKQFERILARPRLE